MKKIIAVLLAFVLVLSFSGCGESTVKINESDNENENFSENNSSDEPVEDNEVYDNKVYYVGDDIPAGSYIIECTKTSYSMDVVVFSGESTYEGFQNADKLTGGEYSAAVETYAWADFNIYENEKAYINLKNGYIILLDDGMCEFTKYNFSPDSNIYPGIYVINEDIPEGKYEIKCIDWMEVTIFENSENYLKYHKTKRFTNGEENAAIEMYSISSDYLYSDDILSVNLKDEMILMITGKCGEIETDNGPIINDNTTSQKSENTSSVSDEKPEESNSEYIDGMRPEFKEAMDSYEVFFDEYCEFMKKYKDNPTDLSLIADYATYMAKYVDTMAKLEKLGEEDLNDAELLYYAEVNNRISQKLLEVAY